MAILTDSPSSQWTSLGPPEEITGGLVGQGREFARAHPLVADTLLAAVLLALSTVWLVRTGFAEPRSAIVQTALVATVAVRRTWPLGAFLLGCAIALAQWLIGFPLVGDGALMIGLYTVAAHESRLRAALAAVLLEAGAVMATLRWEPAGDTLRSLVFLSACVVAALFTGLAVASASRYLVWMDERARRLATERDQKAAIAAAAERTRIARELHDVVSHSLSVVITLADAASVVSRGDPGRAAMTEVADAGRQALSDMRAMLGVLRTDDQPEGLAPQPGIAQLAGLIERVQATGLAVDFATEGTPFPLSPATGLSAYRIVQEALTNAIRHSGATRARVTVAYDAPWVELRIADDGTAKPGLTGPPGPVRGHGIDGMRERAALHGGRVTTGPAPEGGWLVTAALRPDAEAA
jgi:signal transduction histidine kinase